MTDEPTSPAVAHRLRHALVDALRADGSVRTTAVEGALRAVPRHRFLPGVPVEQAYTDAVQPTKHLPDGTAISAASQPSVVAVMLEQLAVAPGHRVLEIGAGTGYNAALLAHLAGPAGHVTTVDVDEDLVDAARGALESTGFGAVRVGCGDGADGWADSAPYDRVIATVGAHRVPAAWLEQAAPTGRLVVPLRLRGSVSRSVAFERDEDGCWRSVSSDMCTFMPLRDSAAADTRHVVDLAGDGSVTVHLYDEQDIKEEALTGVLEGLQRTVWTGVMLGRGESQEWLWLWLAYNLPGALSYMTVCDADRSRELNTQFPWGGMAVPADGALAHLAWRPVPDSDPERFELGVVGHYVRGVGDPDLADRVAGQVRSWNRAARGREAVFTLDRPGSDYPPAVPGRYVHRVASSGVTAAWEW